MSQCAYDPSVTCNDACSNCPNDRKIVGNDTRDSSRTVRTKTGPSMAKDAPKDRPVLIRRKKK